MAGANVFKKCYFIVLGCLVQWLAVVDAIEVVIGTNQAVEFVCEESASAVVCGENFCREHGISEAEDCVWRILVAAEKVEGLAALALEFPNNYESIESSREILVRAARRTRQLRDLVLQPGKSQLTAVLQPHWKLAFSGGSGLEISSILQDWGIIYRHGLHSVLNNEMQVRPRHVGPGRIRLGLVSGWFCNSAIGRLCGGLVEHLDRTDFHVILLLARDGKGIIRRDFYTEDMIHDADEYYELPHYLDEASAFIANTLKLDALVFTDIGMDPYTYGLAFARMAPVQLAFWGHPTTTGIADSIDYYLLMDSAEPWLHATQKYSEQLVRLDSLAAFYRTNESGQLTPFESPRDRYFYLDLLLEYTEFRRQDLETFTLYACPHHCAKYHPLFDEAILGIAENDATALFLLRDCPPVLERLYRKRPSIQILAIPVLPLYHYVAVFGAAHLALEPFPFGGSITTLDAFEVSCPVITMVPALDRHARPGLSASLYAILGLDPLLKASLLAYDTEDYVRRAVALAHDESSRKHFRTLLYERRNHLFQSFSAVREFERFLLRATTLAAQASSR